MGDVAELVHHSCGLVHLLSFPDNTLFWAAGIRQEIQVCAGQVDVDREYVGHCLGLLLRAGSWRLLRNARGGTFRSFMEFCYAPRPHGLGLTHQEAESFPIE